MSIQHEVLKKTASASFDWWLRKPGSVTDPLDSATRANIGFAGGKLAWIEVNGIPLQDVILAVITMTPKDSACQDAKEEITNVMSHLHALKWWLETKTGRPASVDRFYTPVRQADDYPTKA